MRHTRRWAAGAMAVCALLAAGCGAGPPVARKDTVKAVTVTVHYGRGAVAALELPETFQPLETAAEDVTYEFADRGTCKRVLGFLSAVKPRRRAAAPEQAALGQVVVRTGWGKMIRLTWFGSRFAMDGRSFESSQLSKVLATAIREKGDGVRS